MELEEIIAKLVGLWCQTLVDHHKDRDCHFAINTRWSYGNAVEYIVEHNGYILGSVWQEFLTYEEAFKWLYDFLCEKIRDEVKHWNEAKADTSGFGYTQDEIDRNRAHLAKVETELNALLEATKNPHV